MVTDESARRPDQSWVAAAQPWAPGHAPAACRPATAVGRGLAAVALAGCMVVLAAAQHWGVGAGPVRVCNSLAASLAAGGCRAADPFIIVRDGATRAALQIAVPGAAPRAGVPVTVDLRATNGMGLVVAACSTRSMLHPTGGTAALSLQGVFAACRIALPAHAAGSRTWERAEYMVQVRDRAAVLGGAVFHLAR